MFARGGKPFAQISIDLWIKYDIIISTTLFLIQPNINIFKTIILSLTVNCCFLFKCFK